ncbi:efflux RND transporter permease subunit [Ferriphaselus sp. R-1]|uniref:efflux RND transporter permease subunit n=1 Tax=Ferriphaselus sp. R-1 TaxID=1485544 RepID=UPI00054F0994|nr:efflux RND transporter permease subunit [Ferriphaselus sp. R-1]
MSQRGNLTALALGQRELSWFFIALIGIAGLMAYFQLGQREDPDFTFRGMVVRTMWPGATTQQVDEQVTQRIVKKLQEVPYYLEAYSYSRSGESIIILELQDNTPKDQVPELWYQVRKKVDDIRHTLPPEVQGPGFNDEFGDVFGSIYAFTGDGFSLAELRRHVEKIQQRLVDLPDVAKVSLVGVQPEQINITLSNQKLATLGIAPLAIAQVLQQQNIVQDAGRLQAGDYSVPLRVRGEFQSLDELRAMPLRVKGHTLRLADIAEVTRGYQDPPEITMHYAGKPAIGLAISMKPSGDVLRLGKDLHREMAAFRAELPVGVEFARVSDQPAVVEGAVGEFMNSFLEAVAIVLVVSFISLGLRAGLVVAVTIPLVVAATFLLMRIFHIDLHRISTGALIIALGLLVDDAMIVVEMMVRKLQEGYDKTRAATFAYSATVFPMLSGTLVTAAGFLPIGTAQSSTGEYTFAMFAVVTIALIVSWVAAIFVTPLAGHWLLKAHVGHGDEVFDTRFYRRLRGAIEWCLDHRKRVMLATLGLFALGVIGMKFTEKQFFPSSNRVELLAEVWLPEGSNIRATEREAARVEALLAADQEDVVSYVTYAGYGSPRFFLSLDQQMYRQNFAQLVVLTRDMEARERVLAKLQRAFNDDFPGVRARVQRVPLGPPVTYPVEFRVLGDDLPTLKRLGDQVAELMRTDDRLRDVHPGMGLQIPMLRVDVDQDRARVAGVTSQDIARTLRNATEGLPVGQFREADQLIDIVLRTPASEREQLEQVSALQVPSAHGGSVPLAQVARLSYVLEESIIWRKNRDISLSVRADIVQGVQATDVAMDLDHKIDALRATLPPGYRIEAGGELGENSGAQDSINAGMPLMLAVILGVLMIQLKSLSRTVMVLITAPLGIIGVALALLVFHKPFGFVAMLGTIALGGMIMRNTVILIDQIRQNKVEGMTPWDAVCDATVRRFRPIMLTSAAAILAMIPLTRSVLWGPMAYAIMGGLLVATLLTVLFVPALYASWHKVRREA